MMNVPKSKLLPITSNVNEQGHLEIGGCDVVELGRYFGTPLYIYDKNTIVEQARVFREEFRQLQPQAEVIYACKVFLNLGLSRLLIDNGLGFDVVSGGELNVVRTAEVSPSKVYFHGNNKLRSELEEAVSWGIARIVVDNIDEIHLLNEIAGALGKTQEVLVRVSPGVDAHTHHHTTTGLVDSKFGFPIATGQAQEAIRLAMEASNLDLAGLHFHLGSPIFSVEPYVNAIKVVMEFAAAMASEGFYLRELSPGGGFAIAYLEEDEPPEVRTYAEAIVGSLRRECEQWGIPEPRLIVEPGRAMVGRAGVALYTIGSIKRIPGVRTYVSVDGGMGDNIRPALYGAKYDALIANKIDDDASELVTIAGKYCESGDVLVHDVSLPFPAYGDSLVVPASGAYNLAMASDYNLNGRPAVVLVGNGKAELIRRRETYEDMMRADLV